MSKKILNIMPRWSQMMMSLKGKFIFEMCCFQRGFARKGGGGVKACQGGLEHFFPTLSMGVKACQDGLEH